MPLKIKKTAKKSKNRQKTAKKGPFLKNTLLFPVNFANL